MEEEQSFLDKAHSLRDGLISFCTDGDMDINNYRRLRQDFIRLEELKKRLPVVVRRYDDLKAVRNFIRHGHFPYAERRAYIYDDFVSLIEYLEFGQAQNPLVTNIPTRFTNEWINDLWIKSHSRAVEDPDGAITSALSMFDSVMKQVLDECCVEYGDEDLPKLYDKVAKCLNLSPSNYTDDSFKKILGGGYTIVFGIANLRNQLGDAHGKKKYCCKTEDTSCFACC